MEKELLLIGNECNGCYACVSKCPNGCITMQADAEGFWYPKIDEINCIQCRLCHNTCPIINKMIKEKISKDAFAAINCNEEVRKYSSSGGIFNLLARNIIESGGIVFGAAFTDDYKEVEHISVDNMEKIPLLMGSKYLQSRIGDAYNQAKHYLDLGKNVLFSGTPCQIGGLYAYLGKDYENLITQDIICHGVPSPKVWKKYVEFYEKRADSKIINAFFRNKINGWKTFSLQFKFENGDEYIKTVSKDLYMRGFLKDLYLRPSCYNCEFKSSNRISDITLADFWGVENVCADMCDDKGTSLILVNTNKGKMIFDSIVQDIRFCRVDKKTALKYNPPAEKCPIIPENRIKFMNDFSRKNFSRVMNKYCGIGFKTKIKNLMRKFLI